MFWSILDSLLDHGQADSRLMELLSATPLADLGGYRRRCEIWSRIPSVARGKFLAATGKEWLAQAARERVPFVPEAELEAAILEDGGLESRLRRLVTNHAGGAVRLVAALDGYDERRFRSLLTVLLTRTGELSDLDGESVGRLVLERRWRVVAAQLVDRYRGGRRDLKPALRACYELVGLWDRFLLRLVPVSREERWGGFEEVAVELYPGGPDERELWQRAGGNDADLVTKEDGRTRWRRAIRNIRNGRGPTPSALLGAMMEDFPKNERIPHLAGDRVLGGGVMDGMNDE